MKRPFALARAARPFVVAGVLGIAAAGSGLRTDADDRRTRRA